MLENASDFQKQRSLSKLNLVVQYNIIHILKLKKSERVDEKLSLHPTKITVIFFM